LLPQLQATLNSYKNASTQSSPHVLMYGMELPTTLNLGMATQSTDRPQNFSARTTATEALQIAQMDMKRRYDAQHKDMAFEKGDLVKLRLHQGYKTSA
ncbi:uncharacterized protein BO95DRAFT_322411, partial [Aspergillus brunneoviolaceus CBS 621.78]